MWQTAPPLKNCLIILLLLYTVAANSAASPTKSSVGEALSSSPNDDIQLLSCLEKENQSLIAQTEFTLLFKKIEQDINPNCRLTQI